MPPDPKEMRRPTVTEREREGETETETETETERERERERERGPPQEIQQAQREVEIMKRIDHPHCIKLLDIYRHAREREEGVEGGKIGRASCRERVCQYV